MKRLLSLTMITAMIAFAIVACKDDFNEEEFLRLQSELKLKQDEVMRQRNDSTSEEAVKEYIAAANEAGDLLAVSLMVRENGNALAGVSVTLSSGTPNEISSGGRAQAVTSGVTDATGNVVFDRVTIGSGTATFSKTGYVTATASYNFGNASPPIAIQVPNANGNGTITRYAPPVKRFEQGVIPMISATAADGSTATISGKVTIENDVTNLTPEVPSGIILRANLTGLLQANQGFFTSYTLADNSNLGRATIAADGSYTMVVPATAAGTTINLIVPNIEGTSRMAVNGYDNGTGIIVPLPNGPEYRNVPTSWGLPGQTPLAFGNIVPQVAGAKLVFPAAPAVGSGLAFDFTPVPRALVTTKIQITSAQTTKVGETWFKITNRGNYGSGPAPTLNITGGGGQGARADIFMRTYVTALTVTDLGSGYTPNSDIMLQIERVRQDDTPVPQGDVIIVKATSTGTLPATINLADFSTSVGFHPDAQVSMTHPDLKSLRIKVTGTNATIGKVTGTFKTEVLLLDFDPANTFGGGQGNPGTGFTSAPTFTFTGGGLEDGSVDHASVQVVDFPVNWVLTPNNSAATDYPLVPTFSITYPTAPDGAIPPAESNVEVWSASGDQEANSSLASRLTVSGGDVVKRESARVLRTITKSGGKPSIIVTTETPQNAMRTVSPANINTQGNFISFPAGGSNGNGYTSPVTVSVMPAITSAPGSGATITLSNSFDATSLEYTWGGASTINSQGSGYLQNLNQKGVENMSPTVSVSVQAGKTHTLDVTYGTGNRKVNVN